MDHFIQVSGARENNLKNISIKIPRDQVVVFTGVSGSGKSSLAFDTLYAEGQKRYVESLSSYARHFLGQVGKPDVDAIEGLSPAIAIQQKTTSNNPRSTVGTLTEIYDYLRLLWARVGTPHCPSCKDEISRQSVDEIVDQIYSLPQGTRFAVLAPIVQNQTGEHDKILEQAKASGYARVRVDGSFYQLNDDIPLHKNEKHTVEIVVDRLTVKADDSQRMTDSLETAFSLSGDIVIIYQYESQEEACFSQSYSCPRCGISLNELTPRMFSFNNQEGACRTCSGLGFHFKVVSLKGASAIQQEEVDETLAPPCPDCHGDRLAPMLLAVTVGGMNIAEFCRLSVSGALDFIANLRLPGAKATIAELILTEIYSRLQFLDNVGLEYLQLSRTSGTLSGGESQRIRLASQIGSGLTGVLYILDEPSIGLHQRDNARLLSALKDMREMGNTLIVVEHDEETIRQADWIVDIGPGAGKNGGHVVAQGTLDDITMEPSSITGQYLSRKKQIAVPEYRRKGNGKSLTIIGAAENNLKEIDVSIPLGTFTCVTGVSGSGKSSLINEIVYKRLAAELNRAHTSAGNHQQMQGIHFLDKIINIDQSPIGRTPRSNPATYTGLFDQIRSLYALTNEAKVRGYGPGRFSFNITGGRCEACAGDGMMKLEMHFLPSVFVACDACKGKRYNRETLEVHYKGKSIAEVLEMTADEAVDFFGNVPKIRKKIEALCKVGLGYVQLGQSSTTLSGGEAQRVKLAAELQKPATGSTLYVMDEPTTGLHVADVHQLVHILHALVDGGNTVVVIEHNLDLIKNADYIIDLGPEGGTHGGSIVCTGTPEEVANCEVSYTGHYLRAELKGNETNEYNGSTSYPY
ncbi:Excinuclease ABC subunit A [Paenibacillus algorifonticola]|uniref:UvrABC system protein A n=1 Tax=Paenibacillus algorifonticola TaxID=684063 RepID=A0A1I2GVQ0_9BACL|nr:excinuclease ABC subunit UvrA [Paenibacillus algorifonticola]SFF21512.1 Excinuclease ABC subunit A [Paenibacillus algorifonticola]